MDSNYKVLNRKSVYKGRKVFVVDETIQLPNGNIVEWDMIDYPNIFMAIPVTERKTVLMVQQWRQGPKLIMTDFVGARLDSEEEQGLDALKRELKEEIGIEGGEFQKLVSYFNGVRISGTRTIFLVTGFTVSKAKTEENEIVETLDLPLKGLYKNLAENYVTSGDTLLMAKLAEEFDWQPINKV